MSITANVGGALKTLAKVTANVNGALKELNTVHANVSGTLKQIHSAKPTTITGSTACTAFGVYKAMVTNVNIPSACTVTIRATIAETPGYTTKGGRDFRAVNAAGTGTNFTKTTNTDTEIYATATLPAGVYTFQMVVFNVHQSPSGASYTYPTVTYTIDFS